MTNREQNERLFALAILCLPIEIVASFDPLIHRTIADLVYLVRHELDLYDEGEEADLTQDSVSHCHKFLHRFEK